MDPRYSADGGKGDFGQEILGPKSSFGGQASVLPPTVITGMDAVSGKKAGRSMCVFVLTDAACYTHQSWLLIGGPAD